MDYTTDKGRKRYNYAPLSEVIAACKAALSANGLAVTQLTSHAGTTTTFQLETVLTHSSGQWLSSEYDVASYPTNPQQQGSALTYARRYALSALLGVASEADDDGEAGEGKRPTETKAATRPAPKPIPAQTPAQGGEHFCQIHQTVWFKRGNMRGYAHPIVDASGKNIGWCPEKKPETAQEPPVDEIPPEESQVNPFDDAPPQPFPPPGTVTSKPKRDLSTITDTGSLSKALHADFGIQPVQALKELNIKSWPELAIKPSEAYAQIAATR